MSSGLAFVEDYVPEHPSDVIAMLFGEGKDDVADYAAAKPLAHPPGSFWYYSSGTTNIVSRCLARGDRRRRAKRSRPSCASGCSSRSA